MFSWRNWLKRPQRKRPARRRLQLEALESRIMPSTFYVAMTGQDSAPNDGSQAHPWATIQHAADAVHPGDTVIVQAGTYAGFDVNQGGTASQRITFMAAAGAQVLITTPETNRGDDGINIEDFNNGTSVSYVTIQGFTIDNSVNGSITQAGIRAVSNGVVNSTGIILNGNICNDCGIWGIFTSHSDNLLIENNTCSNSQQQHGIYVSNACFNPHVIGNTLFGNASCGLHMNGDASQGPAQEPDGTSDGNNGNIIGALVEDNIIYNNGSLGGSGINGDGVQNSIIRNNLLYNNHSSGISLYQIDAAAPATNNVIVNNTIVEA
jgi:parallel beta-helix repeat protein